MEIGIFKDIVIIFALSTFVNFIFTRLKIPTVVGYLLTGILAGPSVFGFTGGHDDIEILAEIGVVLLMFTIGMEFSLQHLLKIRNSVFFGGFMQFSLTALAFFGITFFFDLPWKSGLFIGFIIALSSSALVLKILQEKSELTSNYGRTIIGILIFQDIMLVPLILFTNLIGQPSDNITLQILFLVAKAIFIIGFVIVGNKWLIPKLLHRIAMTRSQELFFMSILLICTSVALLTYELGMSLAFGAFLAGLMVSESEYSHNAFGSIVTFKDTFTSFFFVSIGMLLDLGFVYDHLWVVMGAVALVIFLKTIIAGATGFVLGHTFKGTVNVGLSLSQVGEFSFILANIGVILGLITKLHYQFFLGVSIITMALTPFLIWTSRPVGNYLSHFRMPKKLRNGLFPLPEIEVENLKNHLVIIGRDTSSINLSVMSKYINLPYISIIYDPMLVKERQKLGETVIYGDAVNEPILHKAHVDTAEIVVVSVGNVVTAMNIVEKVRRMNKHAFILVRTGLIADAEQLFKLGADQVLPEKFEIAIDLFERILNHKLMSQSEIYKLLGLIRKDHYGICRKKDNSLQNLFFESLPDMEIATFKVNPVSAVVNKSLSKLSLRKTTSTTLLAVGRNDQIIEHPDSEFVFEPNDTVYILGKPDNIALASALFVNPAQPLLAEFNNDLQNPST